MKSIRFLLASTLLLTFSLQPVYAITLTEAINIAKKNDPVYIGTIANFTAAEERSNQATAELRPQLTATANSGWNVRAYGTRPDGSGLLPRTSTMDSYESNSAQLRLIIPLWREANWIASQQAHQAMSRAELEVFAAEQDLLVRLAQAWLDVMQADDAIQSANTGVASTEYEWEHAKRGAALGLISGLKLEESRAKFDHAIATLRTAEAEKDIRIAALEQIIGPIIAFPSLNLSAEYTPPPQPDDQFDRWLELTAAANPKVLALSKALEAAEGEIRKQYAGHGPTIDLVGTTGHTMQGVGDFPGQRGYQIRQTGLELQLNLPLYTGGGQSAKIREAIALKEKAAQELEAARREALAAAKQAWFTWRIGSARHSAALQAVKFSSLAAQASASGKISGVKSEREVLQSKQDLEEAIAELEKARYAMILSYVKLKAAAGSLEPEDISTLDNWLTSP